MKTVIKLSILSLALTNVASAVPPLQVSENGRFLESTAGEPFFWLGDTGWGLLNRVNLEEAKHYLDTRREQRFNVIQVFLTAPWMRTNAAGEGPFLDDEPLKLNSTFFKQVDEVLQHAKSNHQYVLLCIGQVLRSEVPQWQLKKEQDAHRFGWQLARRLQQHSNVLWNVGQDFPAFGEKAPNGDVRHLARAMAEGIAEARDDRAEFDGHADFSATLISFHPNGKRGSGEWFHEEPWLAFNMIQTGHDYSFPNHKMVRLDFDREPPKPIVDSEPAYEGHAASFNAANGRISAFHVRRHAYWAVFSGAFGHTYGSNDVWSFRTERGRPLRYGEYSWKQSLRAPGAEQMKHLRALMESVPFTEMLPAQRLVLFPPGTIGICVLHCAAKGRL